MPMGKYKNWDDCISKNKDKNNPEAYCGYIKNKVEGSVKEGLEDACWDGYEAIGFKIKNGKKVPRCVPVSENIVPIYLRKDLIEEEITMKPYRPVFNNKTRFKESRVGNELKQRFYLRTNSQLDYEELKNITEWVELIDSYKNKLDLLLISLYGQYDFEKEVIGYCKNIDWAREDFQGSVSNMFTQKFLQVDVTEFKLDNDFIIMEFKSSHLCQYSNTNGMSQTETVKIPHRFKIIWRNIPSIDMPEQERD
jgi:hypothetical protein